MNLKKVAKYAAIGLLIFFLISDPTSAAATLTNILNTLKEAANSLITFVTSVF